MRQLAVWGAEHTVTTGLQARADLIDGVGLYHTQARVRVETVRADVVREMASGAYAQVESRWSLRVRSMVGVRGDAYTFQVSTSTAANSGNRTAGIVSPEASVALALTGDAELYLSGGYGFHSNDARGTTITVDPTSGESVSRVDPLVRSRGAELGLRASPAARWRTTATAWWLALDRELLFVGDAGITEPSSASRRSGLTVANFYRPVPELALDADISVAHAGFVGEPAGEGHIPGAPENVVASGITWTPRERGLFGSARLRHFGSYPLTADGALRARASDLIDADVGHAFRAGTRLQVGILSLLNATADDIQYVYASRLRGEPADGRDDVHFHPAEPPQVRLTIDLRF